MLSINRLPLGIGLVLLTVGTSTALAQSFGVELHNTLMPASGGMAGVSLAQPQDLTSAINGNPATLARFAGTQFSFGGAWVEPTYNLSHRGGLLPNVGPFTAKSDAQGGLMGNIGVSQDLEEMGLPATLGLGFISSSGGSGDFRQEPNTNGTNFALLVLAPTISVGVDVADGISVGGSVAIGSAFFDGPFVGLGGMTGDYALRGTVGADVQIADRTNVGLYYQSLQSFRFDNAIQLELGGGQFSRVFDVECDLPENVGLGVAHDGLLDGNLLVAVDVLFKQWSETALFGEVLTDQWVLQLGSQYRAGRCRFRAGYAYAEDATREIPASTVGGVPLPRLTAEADYLQALLPAFNEHRLTVGLGICDVLPNVQMDLFAGYMFEDSKNYGALTTASLESYWIGTGLTWGFCPQE